MAANRSPLPGRVGIGLLWVAGGMVVVLLVAGGGFATYWSAAPPARTCLSCHEIQVPYEAWAASAHRDVPCGDCHGGTASSVHALRENARRLVRHVAVPFHDPGLSETEVLAVSDRCRSCHQRAFADWLAGGHSATYGDLFLHEAHNRTEPPNTDCLRCHGMFYEGGIETLLQPPPSRSDADAWSFTDPGRAAAPAIPCLACHAVHTPGHTAARPDYRSPDSVAYSRTSRQPRVGFYDRREAAFFPAEHLPVPRLWAGGRPVTVSPDLRQRVCTQCHAPDAALQAGTGDDRTPRGVHEGLSCGTCHRPHSNDARDSCATCHPAQSNCGLPVEEMNTTYRDPASPNDVHSVACVDCHPSGVPGD